MDQEKHFVENEQTKLITRSKARHLRRKRLNEARKARNQFLVEYINGVDEKNNQETAVHSDSEKATLTKSKARRLRKKEKAKLLETCNWDTSLAIPGALQFEQNICTNTDEYEPYCCLKFERYLFNSHLNNVQHFANLAQSLLSFSNQNKNAGKVEEPIECELKYTKQDKDKSQPYPTQVISIESEDISNSSQVGIPLDLPKFKNKEETHTKTNSGIKRSHLESCNINVDQLFNTSSISEKLYVPNYLTTVTVKQDYEPEGNKITEFTEVSKDISLNNCISQEKKLEETISPGICTSKYGHNIDILQSTVDEQNIIEPPFNEELLESQKNSNKNLNDALLVKEDINTTDFNSVPNTSLVLQRPSEQSSPSENISNTRQSSTIIEEPVSLIKSDTATSIKNVSTNKIMDSKIANTGKTREEIKAEREARKAAKAAAKGKGKANNILEKQSNLIKADLTLSDNTKLEPSKNTIPLSNDSSAITTNLNNTVEDNSAQIKPEGKSKAELRAERRAKQEAQRAVKQEQIAERTKLKSTATVKQPISKPNISQQELNETIVVDVDSGIVDSPINKSNKKISKKNPHEVNLFKHLYHERELALNNIPVLNSKIHPAVIKLGVQYANKIIVGSNARCVALLVAMKQLIQDFEQPSQADFIRSLEGSLQESVAYLHQCRPLAVSMQNALRHLKWQMTQLASTPTDVDAKNKLKSAIDTYILEQIQLADKAISITIQTKISDGNVILTYGYSSLIQKILMDAYDAGKQFRVIIVDGRPWLEGKEQLRRLTKHGIECSYVLINALSFVMPEVSKVFLGAHAILANGAVMSRVGTAQVALMARAFNVPVLVACETHKSCERVQTDSIVYNELGNANDLTRCMYASAKKALLHNWKAKRCLNLLNITYDVTPADLVSAVVTELAILPCTSVPVILRIKPSEI